MKTINNLNLQNKEEVEEAWSRIKKQGFNNTNLIVKESEGKGLGVFAKEKIKKGEIVEFCHVIVSEWKRKYIHDKSILKYSYWNNCACDDCKRHGGNSMILLGNGSIYNSAESSDLKNVSFSLFASLNLAIFIADKDIQSDEEILTWWGQSYFDSWCKKQ